MKLIFSVVILVPILCHHLKFVKASFTADGCGKTKTCFRDPEGCDLSDSNCRFFSWAPAADQEGKYLFEMNGGAGGGGQYIAMALSMKSEMVDADMYYCDGKAVRTGTIQVQYAPPAYNEMTGGLQQISASTVNGVAQCSFLRPASVVKTISNGDQKNFDVTKEEYFLLVASGNMAESGTQIEKHSYALATNSTYNFSAAPGDEGYEMDSNEMNVAGPLTSDGCGETKSCFRDPKGCNINDVDCKFFSWHKQDDSFNFEMIGGSGSGKEYIAIALGTQSAMKDADLYYCDGETVRSGVIRDLGAEPAYVTTEGMSTISAKTVNGVAQCVFKRPVSVTRQISGGNEKEFDLSADSFYLLAALGPMNGDKVEHHTWQVNTESRIISSEINSRPTALNRPKFFAEILQSENDNKSNLL